MNEPRVLTDEEIDEITQQLANSTHGFGGAYKGRTIADLIATIRHERARADEDERLLERIVPDIEAVAEQLRVDGKDEGLLVVESVLLPHFREHLAQRPKESIG